MYTIVGADQKEYGPVSQDQVRQWISEGRANGRTIARFQEGPWKPLSSFPEFASALPLAPPPPPGQPPLVGSAPPGGTFPGPEPAHHTFATIGLTLSILGLFCCPPLFSTLGLVFSVVALVQINQEPGRFTGRGSAIAGIVLALIGYVGLVWLYKSGILDRMYRSLPPQ